ncbi:sunset domain-containing protein [Ilumatobacter nonamiensis]|uniref:sunset domain-containing protein n=1 Tax=Ilumatobacter nonamiensis TaxID=467093 RepID=UPI00034BED8A|nr:hypothetical protein [Ilumatobacter nonamiensis]
MNVLLVVVRRLLWLVLVAALGGAAFAWWRDRTAIEPSGPAEWPPIPPRPQTATPAATETAPSTTAPEQRSGTSSASFVNSLVDAPEARSRDGVAGGWVVADDGSCPIGHPIKAKDNSGIFHVPDGRFYERTNADRCYQSAEAAIADGYRQSKS